MSKYVWRRNDDEFFSRSFLIYTKRKTIFTNKNHKQIRGNMEDSQKCQDEATDRFASNSSGRRQLKMGTCDILDHVFAARGDAGWIFFVDTPLKLFVSIIK
eukprot:GEMP01116205.1.p1 GENE.GEMP01116205.1~~GEMP01116205.1.p1  ORF type:complete len:101 (-),score=3.87 GEMP01116205.1:161-463(-)